MCYISILSRAEPCCISLSWKAHNTVNTYACNIRIVWQDYTPFSQDTTTGNPPTYITVVYHRTIFIPLDSLIVQRRRWMKQCLLPPSTHLVVGHLTICLAWSAVVATRKDHCLLQNSCVFPPASNCVLMWSESSTYVYWWRISSTPYIGNSLKKQKSMLIPSIKPSIYNPGQELIGILRLIRAL